MAFFKRINVILLFHLVWFTSGQMFDYGKYSGFPLGCFRRNVSMVAMSPREPLGFLPGYRNDAHGLRVKCHLLCSADSEISSYFTFFAVDVQIKANVPYCHCIHPAYDESLLVHHFLKSENCQETCDSDSSGCRKDVWLVASMCPVEKYGAGLVTECQHECSPYCQEGQYPFPPVSLCGQNGKCLFGCKSGYEFNCESYTYAPTCPKFSSYSNRNSLPYALEEKLHNPRQIILMSGWNVYTAGNLSSVHVHSHSKGSISFLIFKRNNKGISLKTSIHLNNLRVGVNILHLDGKKLSSPVYIEKNDMLGFGFVSSYFKNLTAKDWAKHSVLTTSNKRVAGAVEWQSLDGMWADELAFEPLQFQQQKSFLAVSIELFSDCQCPENCGSGCDPWTGVCVSCKAGWKGAYCREPCNKGWFGENCQFICAACFEQVCDSKTGACLKCPPGTHGKDCSYTCTPGQWGPQCENKCGHCKHKQPCDVVTGFCKDGCQQYFKMPFCQMEHKCPAGRYGSKCQHFCGFCQDKHCHPEHGNCTKSCSEYFYGPKCKTPCGACANLQTCHPKSGECRSGCASFYKGSKCLDLIECPVGFYGVDCHRRCGKCVDDVCEVRTGFCLNGCKDGYERPLCLPKDRRTTPDKCELGFYGKYCELSCGHCLNDECDREYGDCYFGCDGPFYRPDCQTPCGNKAYGINCEQSCGHCFNDSCSAVNGLCLQGCENDWEGDKCDVKKEWSPFLSFWKLWE